MSSLVGNISNAPLWEPHLISSLKKIRLVLKSLSELYPLDYYAFISPPQFLLTLDASQHISKTDCGWLLCLEDFFLTNFLIGRKEFFSITETPEK